MAHGRAVPESHSSSVEQIQESTWEELRALPVLNLLAEAQAAGISIVVEGDHLRICGPHKAEALGRLLLERKAEVLQVLIRSPQDAQPSGSLGADAPQWDDERAAAVLAKVDGQIEAALLSQSIANNLPRRNVLANERQIVHKLARRRDPFLWQWPRALQRLLRRWREQDAKRDR